MGGDDPFTAYADEPQIENGVHHPYTAFNQGWQAAEKGASRERNPYAEDSREWWWWNMGWHDHGDDDVPEPSIPPDAIRLRARRRMVLSHPGPEHTRHAGAGVMATEHSTETEADMRTITQAQRLQLAGLISLATEHYTKAQEYETAASAITGEEAGMGHTADTIYAGPHYQRTVDELLEQLSIEVVPDPVVGPTDTDRLARIEEYVNTHGAVLLYRPKAGGDPEVHPEILIENLSQLREFFDRDIRAARDEAE